MLHCIVENDHYFVTGVYILVLQSWHGPSNVAILSSSQHNHAALHPEGVLHLPLALNFGLLFVAGFMHAALAVYAGSVACRAHDTVRRGLVTRCGVIVHSRRVVCVCLPGLFLCLLVWCS